MPMQIARGNTGTCNRPNPRRRQSAASIWLNDIRTRFLAAEDPPHGTLHATFAEMPEPVPIQTTVHWPNQQGTLAAAPRGGAFSRQQRHARRRKDAHGQVLPESELTS